MPTVIADAVSPVEFGSGAAMPPIQIEWLAGSTGPSVTGNALLFIESLESVDGPHLPFEFGASPRTDARSLAEWSAGTVSLDVPIEFAGMSRADTLAWGEFAASPSQLNIPIEWLSASSGSTVDGDAHSPIEVLSAARTDALLRAELFGASVRLCFQIEFGYAVKSDDQSPAELMSLARADGTITAEAAHIQRSDSGISAEWAALVAVIADALLRLEFAASQRQDRVPFEFVGQTVAGVENDSAAPIESLATFSADQILTAESLWSILADFGALTEFLRTLRYDAFAQAAETVAMFRQDAGMWAEFSGMPVAILNTFIAIETAALFHSDATVPGESGDVVRGDALTIAEALAAARVRLANIESLAGLLVDKGMPAETTGLLRWDTLAWGEALRSAVLDASVLVEALQSQVSDPPVPSEWQGHIQFIADALVAIEAAGLLRTDAAAWGESTTSLALRDIVVLAEAIRSQVSDQMAGTEALFSIRGDASAPVESLAQARVIIDALVPAEIGLTARADRSVVVEMLASTLLDDRSLTLESAARFLADSGLPEEQIARLVADAAPSVEWQHLIAEVLADAGIAIETQQLSTIPLINIGRYLASKGRRRILPGIGMGFGAGEA